MGEFLLGDIEIQQFWTDGFVCLENAISKEQLGGVRDDVDAWLEESKSHTEPYGEILDGRARFDLQPGHSAESPALRRVTSPVEVSNACLDIMRTASVVDAVAQLIGPNVEFNNCKINAKQPDSGTKVDFHQDFLYQPHSNDDIITVLINIDDVTLDNGPLQIIPGSHRGPIFEHWQDGVFTGAISGEEMEEYCTEPALITGPAGSACLMHTRTLHGSGPNLSSSPRTLFILEYRSEDSKPLDRNHIPSRMSGELVRGVATSRVRCSEYAMTFPEYPTTASFFDQQAKASTGI